MSKSKKRQGTVTPSSRIPGFYKLDVGERRKLLVDLCNIDEETLSVLDDGLDVTTCDNMIENVVGQYGLPFAVATNFCINGQDQLLPMVIEEPSVVAAASNAARMIRMGGGFKADVTAPVMIGQVQLCDVVDPVAACTAVLNSRDEILDLAKQHSQNLVRRGGGPVGLEARVLSTPGSVDGGMIVVHLHIDVRDAMGANMVNTVVEGVAQRLADISRGTVGLRILSNLATQRTVTVTATIPDSVLDAPVRSGIVKASRFAELDPYRATTHNKGIMNGVDAVLMATANDWRSAEAGAHAYAAQTGRYIPLAIWREVNGALFGEMTLPLAVGTVGGALQVHSAAKLALKILGSNSASDLAAACAAAGLACNLAALRALATEGIQRGHMALHSRIVKRATEPQAESMETKCP